MSMRFHKGYHTRLVSNFRNDKREKRGASIEGEGGAARKTVELGLKLYSLEDYETVQRLDPRAKARSAA